MSNAPVPAHAAKERVKLSVLIGDLIQKNRKVLLIAIAAVAVCLVGIATAVTVSETMSEKSLVKAEEFAEQYDTIRSGTDEAKKESATKDLMASVAAYASSSSGYAKARSFGLLATMQADRKEWKEAQASWLASSEALPKSYLAPLGVYNAAACAEEAGDSAKALELYQRCADTWAKDFALAGRAMFAVGRINEQANNATAALAAYQKIIDTWPNDESWTKLANSRIIFLSSRS